MVWSLSKTWSIPHSPKAQAVKPASPCLLILLLSVYCAGVFIILTLLVASCFGLLPDLHFSLFLRVADSFLGISFHRFLEPRARGWTHLTHPCAYTVQMSASELSAWVPPVASAEKGLFQGLPSYPTVAL